MIETKKYFKIKQEMLICLYNRKLEEIRNMKNEYELLKENENFSRKKLEKYIKLYEEISIKLLNEIC